jgi:hypothetical protein
VALGYDTKGHAGLNVAVSESARNGDDTSLADGIGCLQTEVKTVSWAGVVKGTKPGVNCLINGVKLPSKVDRQKLVTFARSISKIKVPPKFRLCVWKLYLDSCATYHSCTVLWPLLNIRKSGVTLMGHCNAGEAAHKQVGDFGPFEMWINTDGIANLLSVPQLERDGFSIDYNTKRNWVLTTPEGQEIVFKRDTGVAEGMPYIDMREQHFGVAMLQTVRKNYEGFTKAQVVKAVLARKAQAKVAHPSDEKFKQMVSHRSLVNSKVKVVDITNARALWGPNRPGLRGKSVREKPERVDPDYVQIPKDFYVLHRFVTLAADVMFVNGISFFMTFSRDIRMITAEFIPSRAAAMLSSALTKIVKLYARGGFVVRLVLMD